MAHIKKVLALLLAACVFCTIGIFAVTAAETDDAGEEVGAAVGITVHYICEDGKPSIYYWNSLPQNKETSYPGPAMIDEGNNYYKYTFSTESKINFLFVVDGKQSEELTRNAGEWWYKNSRWYDHDPDDIVTWDRTDLREDSIYFVITTRFYDGDKGNNVHCWDDQKANNSTPTPPGEATSRV